MAVQTSYDLNHAAAVVGMVDGGIIDAIAMRNDEASASIAFGRAVRFFSSTDPTSAKLPAAETDKIAGIVMHSHAYDDAQLDATGVVAGSVMNILRKGRIWVICEDGCSVGDRLWVRAVSGAAPEYLGGLNSADDSTDMVDCTAQGVWVSSAAAEGGAWLEVDFTNKPA